MILNRYNFYFINKPKGTCFCIYYSTEKEKQLNFRGGNIVMKQLIIILMGSVLSFPIIAEEIVELDKEDLVIAEKQGATAKASPKVVIMNNQQVDQQSMHDQNAQVSSQPVVRVVGAPISTTYASDLKKSRQEAEIQTEQKIVEQLESSRLRDEQERLKKLFGEKSAQKTVVAHPSQTIAVEDGKAVDNSEVYAELVSPAQDEDEDSVYIGLQIGQSSNLTRAIENVGSRGSFGLSFGASDDSGLILESSFLYSKHELSQTSDIYENNTDNYNKFDSTDVYQLSGMLSLKYTPSSNRFKPYVGATVSYNYWVYSDNINSHNACDGLTLERCDNQAKADSIDLGANIGADFQLNKRISIGFNMFVNILNIYNNRLKENNSYDYTEYEYDSIRHENIKVEETNWIIASINAKLYF